MAAIHQTRDIELINRIANSAAVKPFICYHADYRDMDFEPAIGHVAFITNGDDALAVFEQTSPRRWQSHTMFAETCRGRKAVDTGRAIVEFMLPRFADVLWGATPIANKAARWFNRQIGAVVVGHDEYEAEGPVEIFEVRH